MPKRKRVQGPPSSEAEGLPEEIGRRLRELQVHQAELEAQNEELRRRQKELNAILLPGGDVSSLELADILDIPAIQRLMEDFFSLTQMGVAILDLQGKVLVATGWQDICTQFHRIHPETAKYCVQSDTWLSQGVQPGTWKTYRCRNHMRDIATPIMVGGKHVGNLFLGQFFFEDEPPELELFRDQAQRYGFDEKEYLAAYERVPRWSRGKVDTVMSFYTQLGEMVSKLSHSNFKLTRTLAEREQLLDSLRESEEKYRLLIENSHDIIYTLNLDGFFTFVSPGWTALLGHPVDQVVGKPFQQFVHPDDLERCQTFLQRMIETGQRQTGVEYRVRHIDGSWHWHVSNAVPLRDRAGRVVGSEGIASDINERKRLEQEATKARADFLFAVSHELKTPLFLMTSTQELLESLPAEQRVERFQEYGEIWKRNLHRLRHLIENLVDSQRTKGMGLKITAAPTDLHEILERALRDVALLARQRRIHFRLQEDELPMISADPDSLHRLFENLLTNAVKFSRMDGEVEISLRREGEEAVFIVRDYGLGIAPEEIPHLFQPFQRGRLAERRQIPGTGLGLYVSRRIAEAHGGTLTLTSEEGKGVKAAVRLPWGNTPRKDGEGTSPPFVETENTQREGSSMEGQG